MCNPSKKTIKKIERMLASRCKRVEKFKQVRQSSTTASYICKNPLDFGLQGVNQVRGQGQFIATELVKKRGDIYKYNWFYIRSPEQIWGILK